MLGVAGAEWPSVANVGVGDPYLRSVGLALIAAAERRYGGLIRRFEAGRFEPVFGVGAFSGRFRFTEPT